MSGKPPALGYLRTDISGCSQPWHETQMRSRAARLGYDYRKTIAFSEVTDDPVTRLIRLARRENVDAVIVPTLEHLGGEFPRALLMCTDIITVSPAQHETRELTGPALDLFPGKLEGGDTVQNPGADGNAGNSNASHQNSIAEELFGRPKNRPRISLDSVDPE